MTTKSTILAICTSVRKGHSKYCVEKAEFIAGHGIEGDVHAGNWHRQISILALADIEYMRNSGLPGLRFGSFAENLVIGGLDLSDLGPGSRLRLENSVELVITQIGKECHVGCAIKSRVGECIMPTRGLFAVVVAGGEVAVGNSVKIISIAPRESPAILNLASSR
jgi:MOSC domain-containing protein YiiM